MSGGVFSRLRSGYEDCLGKDFIVIPGDRTWSYEEIDVLSGRIARRLQAAGAELGRRVLVQVEKSPEAVATYLGCLRSGATYVPLNPAYRAREVALLAADSAPVVTVCDPERTADHDGPVLTLDASGGGTLLSDIESLSPLDPVAVDAEAIAAMLYTSGTTGLSKGAMLSHRALVSNAEVLQSVWAVEPGDVLLHALPIFHTHGLFVGLHPQMLSGASIIMMPKFDADAVAENLGEASVMMGVPTYYLRLMGATGFRPGDAAGMRLFISGSAPLSSDASDRFYTLTGQRILERYGMTEAGMISSNPLDGERVAGSVGYPLPRYEVRVRGESGAEIAFGEPGVLEIRGPHLFSGYWQQPGRTAEEHTDDGFFHTGDIVTAAEDGRLTIVGRRTDVVISGGLNVYPREVEQALDAIAGVVESAVTGVPDDDLGESVTAFVVSDGVDEATLRTVAKQRLAGYKQPKRYVFVEELPRNAMGKVEKARLPEL